jgi:hypothetical protein
MSDAPRRISPADRDLTPPDRRHKCIHGIPLPDRCARCAEGRPTSPAIRPQSLAREAYESACRVKESLR